MMASLMTILIVHIYQDLAMELYRKDTSCIEVLLHPQLRTLEVLRTGHVHCSTYFHFLCSPEVCSIDWHCFIR